MTHASYIAHPSEGGHVDYAARSKLEDEMLEVLRYKFGKDGQPGRVSTERVVSGKGIINIYEFLVSKFPDKVASEGDGGKGFPLSPRTVSAAELTFRFSTCR